MVKKLGWVAPRDAEGRLIVDAYLRMSDGFDGKEDNRQNQLDDIMPLFAQNNWTLGEVLQDEVSAWKLGKKRDDFEKLLHRIGVGLSAGVAFYNQDRFVRRPSDLERFLDLFEAGRQEMVAASAYGALNLKDDQQRAFMRQQAVNAMAASDATSRRAKRKMEGRRARGLITKGGGRAFAWDDGRVDRTRLQEEQEAFKKAYERIAAGTPTAHVAEDLNARGLLGYFGRPWESSTLRETMKRGRYAGRIEHGGEVVGAIADHEPLIDPEVFDEVQAVFASRKRGGPLTAVSIGSGFLTCGRPQCGGTMTARPRYGGSGGARRAIPTYFCKYCRKVTIDQAPVDVMLRDIVISILTNPDQVERSSKYVSASRSRADEIRAQIKDAEEQEARIMEKVSDEQISEAAGLAFAERTHKKVKALRAELTELEKALADAGNVHLHSRAEVEERWDDAPDNEQRRAMLKDVCATTPVVILPGGVGKAKLSTEQRVRCEHPSGIGSPTLLPRV